MASLPEFRNLIAGELRPATGGKTLDCFNPTTGDVWALAPAGTKADADEAVAAAAAAFPAWSALAPAVRSHFLKEIGKLFVEHGDELSALEQSGIGMIAKTAVGSVMGRLNFLWEGAAAKTLEAATGRSMGLDGTKIGLTRRVPYGVVAAIVPFNAPLPMAVNKMALAIAAGNTVVVKPPEQAPASILRFGELVAKVLPPGVINIVSGLGADIGDPLVRNPAVRRITMTGSSATARKIQAAAAENLTSSIFELGGKSPNIVFADADLDKATPVITRTAIFTSNAGQACVGGSRILVQRPILDEVLQRIEAAARDIVVGDPANPATTMGPLISKAQYDKVVGYIEQGRKTTQLVFGGRHGAELVPSCPGGYWVEPTLFLTTDNALPICQEEIFGPVAVVIPFDTEDEAIAIANDSAYGLAAGVWTQDLRRINRLIDALNTGNVWINTYLETRYELPVSGIKQSGYGHDDILEFTYERAAVIAP
jgi:aldehyde dehydrogenase (NAD+)